MMAEISEDVKNVLLGTHISLSLQCIPDSQIQHLHDGGILLTLYRVDNNYSVCSATIVSGYPSLPQMVAKASPRPRDHATLSEH